MKYRAAFFFIRIYCAPSLYPLVLSFFFNAGMYFLHRRCKASPIFGRVPRADFPSLPELPSWWKLKNADTLFSRRIVF